LDPTLYNVLTVIGAMEEGEILEPDLSPVDEGERRNTNLVLGTQLKLAWLNCGRLTVPKLTIIEKKFKLNNLEFLRVTEAGKARIEDAEELGWITTSLNSNPQC